MDDIWQFSNLCNSSRNLGKYNNPPWNSTHSYYICFDVNRKLNIHGGFRVNNASCKRVAMFCIIGTSSEINDIVVIELELHSKSGKTNYKDISLSIIIFCPLSCSITKPFSMYKCLTITHFNKTDERIIPVFFHTFSSFIILILIAMVH